MTQSSLTRWNRAVPLTSVSIAYTSIPRLASGLGLRVHPGCDVGAKPAAGTRLRSMTITRGVAAVDLNVSVHDRSGSTTDAVWKTCGPLPVLVPDEVM